MTLADPPLPMSADHWAALRAAYAVPARAYHNFGHVRQVLAHYSDVAAGPGWRQPKEIWLAALYHDAIYQPGRKDNEARSAELAVRQIAAHWPRAGIDAPRVAELILLTARHGQLTPQDVDHDAALFLDCDMAILGADAAAFDAYDQGIADEYAGHAPGWLFRRERRRFCAALLEHPRIFLSEYFHQRYDAPARANLRRRLAGGDQPA
jgi:predicted metal-dependent HD superfamily phosphohydrolase